MRVCFLLMLFFLQASAAGAAGRVCVGWDRPVAYIDSSPLPAADIIAYRLYYGTAPGAYTGYVTAPGKFTNGFCSTKFAAGAVYYFAVSALTGSAESELSSEISGTITNNSWLELRPSGLTIGNLGQNGTIKNLRY